jgi:hypothetical protein
VTNDNMVQAVPRAINTPDLRFGFGQKPYSSWMKTVRPNVRSIPNNGHHRADQGGPIRANEGSRNCSVDDILRGLVWRKSAAPQYRKGVSFNFALEHDRMVTCYLRYEADPDKLADFEACGAMWLDLMPRFGGIHHGYFLPSEGKSDIALAMFSFPSLAAYEQYRKDAGADPDVQKAVAFAKKTRCFARYERSFFRPLLPKTA